MTYQILGASKKTIETKNGKHFRRISVIDPQQRMDNWDGICAETITLWDSALEVLSVETVDGMLFSKNSDTFIDIDYNARGYIVSARVYNKRG